MHSLPTKACGFCSKKLLATVVLLVLLGTSAAFVLRNHEQSLSAPSADLDAPGPYLSESKRIRDLHLKKLPPKPGDWLSTQFEAGQPFGQFLRSSPMRPTEIRQTLYVQPLGDFEESQHDLLADTAELMSHYFNLRSIVLDPVELNEIPEAVKRVHLGSEQILTTYLLQEVLKPLRPDDAVAVLGMTTVDLWPGEGWNFFFGQAIAKDRVGVWSLSRYGDPNENAAALKKYRERTFKVALHETGHMLSMSHCIYYECLMNGFNHLEEMDSRPLWICPECVRKVWWTCNATPGERFRNLVEFSEKHDLQNEAQFWHNSLQSFR